LSVVGIHPTAVIGERVQLGVGVRIGPYCVLNGDITIGDRSECVSHVVVGGRCIIGAETVIYPFAALGMSPQTRVFSGGADSATLEEPSLSLGSNNVVREHVTIHPGACAATTVGDNGLFMAGSHIAHDVRVGSFVTLANSVQLAGHVQVADHVTFGGLAGAAQHVRIGEAAFVAAGSMVERDVPPYVIVQGDRARVRALNKVGLRRCGVAESEIDELESIFRDVFVGKRVPREALHRTARASAFAELLAMRFTRSGA
jgi:UDP-N-acetylglucosamine acyltransferase